MFTNFVEKYLTNKRIVVEIIFSIIFFLVALKYFGIPDIYDVYVYWVLGVLLIASLILYVRLTVRDLRKILNSQDDEE